MFTVIVLVSLIALAALAPRFGADSRDFAHDDSFPALPDHTTDESGSYRR
jgi:hypothetical protein